MVRAGHARPGSSSASYDADSGVELARATVDDVGFVGKVRHRPADRPLAKILDIDAARDGIQKFDHRARGAQYVSTWGTLQCDEVNPCVAMRNDSSVYLLDGRTGHVFRSATHLPQLSFRQDLSLGKRRATLRTTAEAGERLVSLGRDVLARAEWLGTTESEANR